MFLLLIFAFLAGIVTVLSPCVLPVLPAILAVSANKGKKRPLGVITGLICSFVFFTLALTSLVHWLGISANILRYFAIGVIALFGLVSLIPSWGERFAKWTGGIANLGTDLQTRARQQHSQGFWGGWLMGVALGLVWTPCAGPILAAITTLVATQKVTLEVFLLTCAYSLGAGLPLLLIAYGGNRALNHSPFLAKHATGIRQLFGGIMILTALALFFNWDTIFQQKVLDYLPSLKVENSSWLQERLQQFKSSANPQFNLNNPLSQPTTPSVSGDLPRLAPAPPFVDIKEWINSKPLKMSDLLGDVVLIDFWTYSCINCIRTLPYLRDWNQKYKDLGLVIVGVHTPEFEFEKNLKNVEDAVKRFQITYPVGLDNNYGTWQAYSNAYWPAHYLIDQEGIVRQVHFGEGKYLETENAIRYLLGLAPLKEKEQEMVVAAGMTPETYLGYKRAQSYSRELSLIPNREHIYDFDKPLQFDQVGLKGKWDVKAEKIVSVSDDSKLEINFMADQVYLVLGGPSSLPVKVELDGQLLPQKYATDDAIKGEIQVKEPRKYDILNLRGDNGRHVLSLQVPKGIEAYAFTFGMENLD